MRQITMSMILAVAILTKLFGQSGAIPVYFVQALDFSRQVRGVLSAMQAQKSLSQADKLQYLQACTALINSGAQLKQSIVSEGMNGLANGAGSSTPLEMASLTVDISFSELSSISAFINTWDRSFWDISHRLDQLIDYIWSTVGYR